MDMDGVHNMRIDELIGDDDLQAAQNMGNPDDEYDNVGEVSVPAELHQVNEENEHSFQGEEKDDISPPLDSGSVDNSKPAVVNITINVYGGGSQHDLRQILPALFNCQLEGPATPAPRPRMMESSRGREISQFDMDVDPDIDEFKENNFDGFKSESTLSGFKGFQPESNSDGLRSKMSSPLKEDEPSTSGFSCNYSSKGKKRVNPENNSHSSRSKMSSPLNEDEPSTSGFSRKSVKKRGSPEAGSSSQKCQETLYISDSSSDDLEKSNAVNRRQKENTHKMLSFSEALREISLREKSGRSSSHHNLSSDWVYDSSSSDSDNESSMPSKKLKPSSNKAMIKEHMKKFFDKVRASTASPAGAGPAQPCAPAPAPPLQHPAPVYNPPAQVYNPPAAAYNPPPPAPPVAAVAPQQPHNNEVPPGMCSVCQEKPVTVQLACRHAFCEPCIVRVKASPLKFCPKCRKSFRKWHPCYI